MKKLFLISALLLGASAISIASEAGFNTDVPTISASRPANPTHWGMAVTNPDNPREGKQEKFYFAYDSDGVIWIYSTNDQTFTPPIRTVTSGRSDFKYKFMQSGVLWYLAT
ncbi:MAG: hypothetical protein K2M93_02530 [Muribaculaceae bacterium]|nr:hypothetical protein [Muribaculaceae bacterium]